MRFVDIKLFDSFSDRLFGGNVAGVVAEAGGLDDGDMQKIACEIAAPVTGFASTLGPNEFDARFFTPKREIDMCGHVVVALFTQLAEDGDLAGEEKLDRGSAGAIRARLRTKAGPVDVEVRRQDGQTDLVMMRQKRPAFQSCEVDPRDMASLLGVSPDAIEPDFPIETVSTGLRHLFVPVRSLEVVKALSPDMKGLTELSRDLAVETVDAFALETVHSGNSVHSRDFCPAVGVPEAPASGTTNGSLTCYLIRNGILAPGAGGVVTVLAEQGYEIGRPSHVRCEARVMDGEIIDVLVGGTAVRSMEGRITLPSA
jgi:PhzF family phenazine biosynthesis protein